MRSSKWFLRTALALPIVILIAVGLRTWQLEGAQLELEHQSSLRGLALGVVLRLERWQAGEPWPGERLSDDSVPTRIAADVSTQDLLVLLGSGFDRTMLEQGHDGALRWLSEQNENGSPEKRTWLKLRRANLHRQQDHSEQACAIWRELSKQPRSGRDERGIRFDLTARALLLFEQPTQGSIAGDAKDLAIALVTDQRDQHDFGTAVLAERVVASHAANATKAAHQELLDIVREHQLNVAWRSLYPTVAQLPTGERRLAYTPKHGGWLLAFAPEQVEAASVRGIPQSQLNNDLFGGTTGELIAELGIRIDLANATDGLLATSIATPSNVVEGETLLRQDLPSGLGAVTVTVDPMSPAAGRRSERRTMWLLAISLAVMAALVAGVFGLRALRQQEQLNEQRAGFVAAVSHELKTPLTATRLLGELLERGDLDDAKVREFGGRIARESERLDQLVRNVLDLARVERIGLQPGQKSLVAPGEMWGEAIARHEQAMPGSPHPVLVERGALAWRVHADRESLMGALANLLENGARHATESETLDVAVVRIQNRVRLEVRDRGQGVPEPERRMIFGEFYRGGNEDTRQTRGTGIGLTLVARIAAAHNGKAYCESREGGGSVFVIELPLAPSNARTTATSQPSESTT